MQSCKTVLVIFSTEAEQRREGQSISGLFEAALRVAAEVIGGIKRIGRFEALFNERLYAQSDGKKEARYARASWGSVTSQSTLSI